MASSWLVLLLVLAGVLLVAIIFLCCFFGLREIYRRSRANRPLRTTSRVYPRISSPIYAISNNSIDKFSTGGGKKRHSSAFSGKTNYYDCTNSPQVPHKEYLDFDNSAFDDLPQPSESGRRSFIGDGALEPADSFYSLPPQPKPPRHINVAELERTFGAPNTVTYEPVKETYRDSHVTYKRPHQYDN